LESKDEPINIKITSKTKNLLYLNHTVLDLGCGIGTAAIEIASNVNSVIAIDISLRMIELAKVKSEKHNVKNIDFIQTSIFDDKFKIGSFDAILSFYLLHLIQDPSLLLQRINSLLKPGGLFISATPCISGTYFSSLLSPLSKIGLIPLVSSFKQSELINLIIDASFYIVEVECLHKSGNQNFIVAKKK
jgi:2-polyprenyl-3-methyl-5-hydroxy-6-metoxy-1,4-benzoquinol methylase